MTHVIYLYALAGSVTLRLTANKAVTDRLRAKTVKVKA